MLQFPRRVFIRSASTSNMQYNEIRKTDINIVLIGKATVDNDKEDLDNDADDDDAENAEESEGDEFEQETG